MAYREDPAQLDPAKRELGIDGLRSDDHPHRCRTTATRITNPDVFATAFARGVEHPDVRAALDDAYDPAGAPDYVTVPIAELLGPDAHRHCTGWRLDPAGKSMNVALGIREDWISKSPDERTADFLEPQAAPLPGFKDGDIVFAFMRNNDQQRYEVITMFCRPGQPKPGGDSSGLE